MSVGIPFNLHTLHTHIHTEDDTGECINILFQLRSTLLCSSCWTGSERFSRKINLKLYIKVKTPLLVVPFLHIFEQGALFHNSTL